MRQFFSVDRFKDAFLVLLTIAFVIEVYYYCILVRRRVSEEEEITRVMSDMNIASSDLWVTHHAHLSRESIIKLRENSCKIPILNPFAPQMMGFFKPYKLSCQKIKTFYFKSHVKGNDLMILTQKGKPIDLRCCYEQLRFAKIHPYKPNNLATDRCTFFAENKTIVPSDSEYLIIKCWDSTVNQNGNKTEVSNSKLEKYLPTHYELLFYVPKPSPELLYTKRKRLMKSKIIKDDKHLNVIILGFDQVSRANFIRLMGKTFDYLRTELGAIDLQGFNKMGDATLNNTLAMLTGHDFGSIKNSKYFSESNPFFDECPWIWKNFSDKGYITAYADDYTSVFNYRFNGFKTQPTDYYMTPFLQWYNQMKRHEKFGSYSCIGNEQALDLLQDQARKVAAAVGKNPYFHFLWISRIHEHPGYPALADKSTLETLKYFQSTGVLNRSLVILLSDHGWRAGSIMMDPQARLENRLSFAFLLLPHWFQEKYFLAYANLQENQYRLTSPYDIHATLKDILDLSGKLSNQVISQRKTPSGSSKGASLFLPISKERSCADAGIDEEWCACTHYENFAVDSPIAIQLASYAVATLNSWLGPYPLCEQYSLDKILSAEVNRSNDRDLSLHQQGIALRESQQFRISFSVLPKGANFEVTVFTDGEYWHNGGSQRISMSTEVFRLNVYNSANCMKLYSLKKICTCKD